MRRRLRRWVVPFVVVVVLLLRFWCQIGRFGGIFCAFLVVAPLFWLQGGAEWYVTVPRGLGHARSAMDVVIYAVMCVVVAVSYLVCHGAV